MIDYILTILAASLVCNGIDILLDEGFPLHFIRKRFDDHRKKVEKWREEKFTDIDQICNDVPHRAELYAEVRQEAKRRLRYHIVFKPFFLCLPCMASVWGTFTLVSLSGAEWRIVYYIVGAIAVIPTNLIIFKLIKDV